MKGLGSDPQLWSEIMSEYAKSQAQLMTSLVSPAEDGSKNVAQHNSDRRFASEQWNGIPLFSFLKNSYLMNSKFMLGLLDRAPISAEHRKLLTFMFNQYIDAMSPANFPTTNPEVIEATVNSGGSNLAAGARNLMEDMKKGAVSNTDRDAFEIGGNIAVTPGKIVLENRVMQLIEYAPQTPKVREVPIVIYPPCINKFYILDLVPEKSLVAHLVRSGYRVFLVSWVNAGEAEAQLEWDDYLVDGIMKPMDAVRDLCKQEQVNALGFCIGGTLLSSALAVAAASGEFPIRSLTLLATMVDCHDTGDIGLFITPDSVAEYERKFASGGLMSGLDLAKTFSALRPNDLIWPYVIKNYYMGESPPAFDMLYWNSDSTNLPGRMFVRYVRETYLENNVAEGRSTMCGVKVDLDRIRVPCYALATEKDHIVPWQSAYMTARRLGGPVEFILGSSGHIAGVVSPPEAGRGQFRALPRTGRSAKLPADTDKWLAKAKANEGSWWPHWIKWLAQHSGRQVAAPERLGSFKYKPVEDAPGSYVTSPLPPIQPEQGN